MTAPRWPSISDTIWHQRYCVLPNLRESAVHAAASPARPRLSASAHLWRGGHFQKGGFWEDFLKAAFDAAQLEEGMLVCWKEVRSWWGWTSGSWDDASEDNAGCLKAAHTVCWDLCRWNPCGRLDKLFPQRWAGTCRCTLTRTHARTHTRVCVFSASKLLCLETLVAGIWQAAWKGFTKGRFSLSWNGESRPAEERGMDLLQMPPWVH